MKLHYIAYHKETGEAKQLTVDSSSIYRVIGCDGIYETMQRSTYTTLKDDIELFLRLHSYEPRFFIWDIRRVKKGVKPWPPEMYLELRGPGDKTGEKGKSMDKRLAFGRIVGRQVQMKETGEIGICEFYDRVEHAFSVSLKSYENKYNPDGICTCDRDSFTVV